MLANLLDARERGQWRDTPARLEDLAKQMAESAARDGIVCQAAIYLKSR
jgi:cobalamin biosynthesis Mg chelatase CobN